jgi:hypothetical protein
MTMVGVLMDAHCAAITGESRHSAPARVAATQVASKKKTAAREGTRARATAGKSTSDEDRYAICKATAVSTAFAIHTDGRLYVLDEAGNDLVRAQMRNESFRSSLSDESGEPRWLTVMVEGKPAGNSLSVLSLRR